MATIYHLMLQADWEQVDPQTGYRPPSLAEEGFIHCSTREQIVWVANQLYRGVSGAVLLEIDPEQVQDPIVYEDCYDVGQAFPHIYGPLWPTAAVRIIPFPCNPDGSFTLPPALESTP